MASLPFFVRVNRRRFSRCGDIHRRSPDKLCFIGPDASVWVRQTSFRLTLQADFAANCKIWVEQGAPSEVFAAPETETLKEYLQIGH